jgi:hypothetical protein
LREKLKEAAKLVHAQANVLQNAAQCAFGYLSSLVDRNRDASAVRVAHDVVAAEAMIA